MNSQSCQLRIDYFIEDDESGPQRRAKETNIFYGGQKLHVAYFSALLKKYTSSLLTCSYIGQLRSNSQKFICENEPFILFGLLEGFCFRLYFFEINSNLQRWVEFDVITRN